MAKNPVTVTESDSLLTIGSLTSFCIRTTFKRVRLDSRSMRLAQSCHVRAAQRVQKWNGNSNA